MQFGFLGIDYKNADLTIRDEISFTDQKKLEFFHKAEKIGVEQVMILSTCNRSEIYYFFDDEQQIKKIQNIYNPRLARHFYFDGALRAIFSR